VIRRTIHLSFQFIGVLAVGFAIVLIGFFWRLSSGPLSIAYFTPYFESALSEEGGDLRIRLDDTILTWAEVGRTLDIRLIGAKAIGANGNIIAEIPELSVSLSAAALLQGRFAPRTLSISGPSLKILREEDGNLDFGFSGEGVAANAFAKSVMTGLLERSKGVRAIDFLVRLNILGAHLTIDDRRLGVVWDAPDANIVLKRTGRGVTGQTDLALRVADQVAALQVNADYDAQSKLLAVSIGFADFNPSLLAGLSKKVKFIGAANIPASGTVSFITRTDGQLKSAEFNIATGRGSIGAGGTIPVSLEVEKGRLIGSYDQGGEILSVEELTLELGENGRIELPAPIDHVMPLKKISLSGNFSWEFDRLDIQRIEIDTPGPKASGSATLQEIGDELSIALDLTGGGLDAGRGKTYWPKKLGSIAREWIVENITEGAVDEARVRLIAGWSKKDGFKIVSLAGDLKASGLSVDYFAPMAKIVESDARAKFDQKRFDITVTSGRSGDLIINSGRVLFTDMDKFDQFADIEVDLDGPLSSVLQMIDGEPLDFARQFNIRPGAAKGRVSTKLKLNFLVERTMTADTIKVAATSDFQSISLPGVAFGFDLTKSDLALSLDNRGMEVSGQVNLGGINTDFQWRHGFDKKEPASSYRIKAELSEEDWRRKLGLKIPGADPETIRGPIAADLNITVNAGGEGRLDAKLDLKGTTLSLAKFDWTKDAGTDATANISANFRGGKFRNISKLSFTSAGLEALGSVKFNEAGGAGEIRIGKFKLGDTDIAAVLIPVDGGWEIDVRGKNLDLRGWIDGDENEEQKEYKRGETLSVSFSLEKALLEAGQSLANVTGAAVFDGLVWRNVQFSGGMKGGKDIAITIAPKDGGRSFLLTSSDAGAALKVLDFNENIVGGKLRIEAVYKGMMPDSRLQGNLVVNDFRVLDAPVFAQLLSIASLTGILEALGGEGLQFNGLIVPFVSERGVIRVDGARATGITLGVTASGTVDERNETIDIKGTLIPAYLINSALGRLPIVGPLFSGGEKGGGVFAAEFRVKGKADKPEVSTNPLTAFAPGFLRNFFKVFERKDKLPETKENNGKERSTN